MRSSGCERHTRAPRAEQRRPTREPHGGVFLACGFVVDVDLLWTNPGEGDIAPFDFVASARAGTSVRRIIAECKGGDRWGYSDAFQLLGQTVLTGQEQAVLLVAQRHSAEREARSARTISRQFAGTGLHAIAVPVDDRLPGAPVADIGAVEHTPCSPRDSYRYRVLAWRRLTSKHARVA